MRQPGPATGRTPTAGSESTADPGGTHEPQTAAEPGRLVIPADAADLDALSGVIAEAFHPLAPSQWLIPDPGARRQVFPGYFRIFVEHALAHGTVHTTPDRACAALWIPAGPGGPVPPARYPERLAAVTGPWAHRFRAFDAALDARHPAGISHHYLAMLAVHPSKQGRGTGTALLRAHHHTLDQQNISAYLEASDLRTRQLYLRNGYTDLGGPIELPGHGPLMHPMMRRHDHAQADRHNRD